MIGRTLCSSIIGIDAEIIKIEADIFATQLPRLTIVGLPDKAVQEAGERITAAIKNSGFEWPRKRIIINLAPADIPKSGTLFDLPIAIAILHSSGQVDFDWEKYIFAGELALDGSLRSINGALSISLKAKNENIENIILPTSNAEEAGLVHGIKTIGVHTLKETVEFIEGNKSIEPTETNFESLENTSLFDFDMKNIKGQLELKRAIEIAAAGSHNILLSGTPGSGKTMIARTLGSILPKLTFDESIELTRIYSVSNLLSHKNTVITQRPFRSPHHTASTTSLIGGGKVPKPGEVSLAHRGILFLDELPEFPAFTLDALRQPIEDKKVSVSRVSGTIAFPANFTLVGAMNPCKCGWKGDKERECKCSAIETERYTKKVSGPILDRIDLQLYIPRVKIEDLTNNKISDTESSFIVKERIQKCKDIQLNRYKNSGHFSNSDINQKEIEKYCILTLDAKNILTKASEKLMLSARSYFRVLRVARTIADLNNSDIIEKVHITEALQYRLNEI